MNEIDVINYYFSPNTISTQILTKEFNEEDKHTRKYLNKYYKRVYIPSNKETFDNVFNKTSQIKQKLDNIKKQI